VVRAGKGGCRGGKGRVRGKGGEMTQTIYAYMNKIKIKKILILRIVMQLCLFQS
jgi:hypothetical protein